MYFHRGEVSEHFFLYIRLANKSCARYNNLAFLRYYNNKTQQ